MATAVAALRAIKTAVQVGAWRPDPHLFKQIAKRGLTLADALTVLARARRAVPHDMRPLNAGGESWRVYGQDMDGREIGVGIELVADGKGKFIVIITAFVKE